MFRKLSSYDEALEALERFFPSSPAGVEEVSISDACGRVYCLGGEWGTFEFFSRRVLPDLAILRTEMAVAWTIRALSVRSTDTADDERDLSEVYDDAPI